MYCYNCPCNVNIELNEDRLASPFTQLAVTATIYREPLYFLISNLNRPSRFGQPISNFWSTQGGLGSKGYNYTFFWQSLRTVVTAQYCYQFFMLPDASYDNAGTARTLPQRQKTVDCQSERFMIYHVSADGLVLFVVLWLLSFHYHELPL